MHNNITVIPRGALCPSFLKINSGFSLIELLIAITIIAILAGMSIPIYLKYQQKSKVSSYALPIVKACAHDALGYCSILTPDSDIQLDVSTLPNCSSTVVPGGSLIITITGSVICQPNGTVREGVVRGSLQGVTGYDSRCSFEENGIQCTVVAI